MKIIENDWNQSKEVVYKGNILIVPIWTNWVATCSYGHIVAFDSRPNLSTEWWESNVEYSDILYIGEAKFEENEDWKQSIEYVGE